MDKTIGSLKVLTKTSRVKSKKESIELDNEAEIEYESDDDENKRKADLVSKKRFKTKTSVEIEESKHKIILDEVPKWYKLTMDEAAALLAKHVCYFNVERESRDFI